MGMQRHDYLVLVTRTTCAALAIASFVILEGPSLHSPVSEVHSLVVNGSTGLQLMRFFAGSIMHVCVLLQWMPPQELYSHDTVDIHWMFTVWSLGLASAGVGVVHSHHFSHRCGGSLRDLCRRCEISSWVALVMAVLSIVDVLVLRWATRRAHQCRPN